MHKYSIKQWLTTTVPLPVLLLRIVISGITLFALCLLWSVDYRLCIACILLHIVHRFRHALQDQQITGTIETVKRLSRLLEDVVDVIITKETKK